MNDENGNILVIESALSILRISLAKPDGTIAGYENADRYSHAENILPLVERVLKKGDVNKSDLSGIVISKGPGSFTGLRIGMATAKGLAISLGCPLAAVSVFAAAAVRLPGISKSSAVLIPSRRDEYYLGMVTERPFNEGEIRVLRSEELSNAIGSTKVLPLDFDPERLPFPKRQLIKPDKYSLEPWDYIDAGRELLKSGGDDLERLEPLYIQPFPAVRKS